MKQITPLLLLMLVALFATGCGLFDSRPAAELPAEFRITASAPIESGLQRTDLSESEREYLQRIEAGTFRATATGEPPASSSGRVQALAFARARARHHAVRNLATEITGPDAASDDGLEAIFGPRAAWAGALSEGLRERAQVEFQETETGVVANASIPGAAVVEALSAASATAAGAESPRARAEREALENAREALVRQVMTARGGGRGFERELRQIVAQLRPADVTEAGGEVRVELALPSALLPAD